MKKIIERISLMAENEAIKITYLEREIGASKGVLSRALTNKTDIQSKWITKLVENYPQYSSEWLLTGREPMLKKVKPSYPNHLVGKPDSEEEKKVTEMFTKLSTTKESIAMGNKPGPFIASLEDHIATLKRNNQYFIERITYLENQLTHCNCTNTAIKPLKVAEEETSYALKKPNNIINS